VGRKGAERQIVIEGSQQECFDAIVHYETFPGWQRAVTEVAVISRHRDGRAKLVAFQIDTKVRKVRYTLDYSYEEPHLVSWRYVEGDPRNVAGELVLENRGDGTTLATYSLAIEPGARIPDPLVDALSEQVLSRALEDLKARVEGLGRDRDRRDHRRHRDRRAEPDRQRARD
jgi:hypothetical protein